MNAQQAQDGLRHNAFSMSVSRETAILHGLIKPTAQERDEMSARAAEWERRDALRRQADAGMLAALRAKGDATINAMLDLHKRTGDTYPACDGEDFSGYDADPGDWPCRTVLALAKAHGVPTREDVQ